MLNNLLFTRYRCGGFPVQPGGVAGGAGWCDNDAVAGHDGRLPAAKLCKKFGVRNAIKKYYASVFNEFNRTCKGKIGHSSVFFVHKVAYCQGFITGEILLLTSHCVTVWRLNLCLRALDCRDTSP
jgi:hypothetical protein